MTQFNLTLEQYDRMLEAQEGACAICRRPEVNTCHGKVIALAVDHDHATGRVRGLLCSACNVSLARVERAGFLSVALAYLRQHGSKDPSQ